MGMVTIRPDGVINDGGTTTTTGAGGAAAVLGDSADATYFVINTTAYGNRIRVTLPTPALPVGATIQRVTPRIRVASSTGSPTFQTAVRYQKPGNVWVNQTATTLTATTTARTLVAPSSGALNLANTATAKGTLEIWLWAKTNTVRFLEIAVDVYYDEAPSAVNLATSPAGAEALTTRPGITWQFQDPEGSVQQAYWVEIWDTATITAAQAAGKFDASGLPSKLDYGPFAANGYVDAQFQPVAATHQPRAAGSGTGTEQISSALTGSVNLWFPDVDLPNNQTYRAFVWVADDGAGTGTRFGDRTKVGTLDFTMAVPVPPSPQSGAITVTRDATKFVDQISVQAFQNVLTANQSDLGSDLSGWEVDANATIARTTTIGNNGVNALQITATAAGTAAARTLAGTGLKFQVPNTGNWTFMATVRAATIARSCTLQVRWYTTANTLISTTTVATATNTTTGWTTLRATVAKPATAVYAVIVVQVAAAAAAEVHYVDTIGAFPGTVTTWSRGGLTGEQYALIERTTNGGATWKRIFLPGLGDVPGDGRNALLLDPTTQQASTYDPTLPPGATVQYRFRTMSQDLGYLVTSPASTATTALATVSNRFLLRDPDASDGRSFVVSIAGDLTSTSTERQGSFQALGREFPLILSDAISGETWQATYNAKSPAQYTDFEALRALRKTLLFQDDMGGQYWVRLGPDRSATLRQSTSRVTNQYREVTFSMIEVDPPEGAE